MNREPGSSITVSSVRALLVRPVAFHPVLARISGSVHAGVMLSQAIYWTDVQERTNAGAQGWFFKTQHEWNEETCLSRAEQETARRKLVARGFIEEQRKGLPARLYFRVNLHCIIEAVENMGTLGSRMSKSTKQGCSTPTSNKSTIHDPHKQPNKTAGAQHPYHTETTAESTAISTLRGALKKWLWCKEELRRHLSAEEWDLWVRPARLLALMANEAYLIAVPPAHRIMTIAKQRQPLLSQLLGAQACLTPYPDEYQRNGACQRL